MTPGARSIAAKGMGHVKVRRPRIRGGWMDGWMDGCSRSGRRENDWGVVLPDDGG